jgi:solute carrier family 35, member E1
MIAISTWGMSTTTVTGTGPRSSIRQLPTKTASPLSMSSPVDKFPVFIDDSQNAATDQSPSHLAHPGRHGSNDFRQPYKAGHVIWEHLNGSASPKHRPRKSIGEAFNTIRTQSASMSTNAHELAAALGAPVSYKLIVREPLRPEFVVCSY